MIEYRVSETRRIAPDRINDLRKSVGRYACDPDEWRGLLSQDSMAVCSAWEKGRSGRLIGFGLLMETVDGPQICDLVVDKSSQRQGVGRAVAERLIQIAFEQGAPKIEAIYDKKDPAAQAFYRALGFEEENQYTTALTNPAMPVV